MVEEVKAQICASSGSHGRDEGGGEQGDQEDGLQRAPQMNLKNTCRSVPARRTDEVGVIGCKARERGTGLLHRGGRCLTSSPLGLEPTEFGAS